MMAWFRSHHANQSWLTALTALMDSTAVVSLCSDRDLRLQAGFTFAMIRPALSDVSDILHLEASAPGTESLTNDDFSEIERCIQGGSASLHARRIAEADLRRLTFMYEPHARVLSDYLLMALRGWRPAEGVRRNWKAGHTGEEPLAISDPFRND